MGALKLFDSQQESQEALQQVIGEVLAELRNTPDFPPEDVYLQDVIRLRELYRRFAPRG